MQNMIDTWVRCPKCGHKLFKGATGWHEVKCHSCKTITEIGTQFDKLISLLESAGIPFRSTRMTENGVISEKLIVLLNNDEKAEYERNMSLDAETEFRKLADNYGFFSQEVTA